MRQKSHISIERGRRRAKGAENSDPGCSRCRPRHQRAPGQLRRRGVGQNVVEPLDIIGLGTSWISGSPLPLAEMRLEAIQAGDIVEVDQRGRRFHALVTENVQSGLLIEPIDRRISYRSCRARQVLTHWAKRGRPRQGAEAPEASADQLELESAAPPGDPLTGSRE